MRAVAMIAVVMMVLGGGQATAQQVVDYKGRHIQVGPGEQSAQCLALLRKAIDMTAELRPKQRAMAAEIKDLRCNPRPSTGKSNEVKDNTVGVYTMTSLDDPSGHINFPIEAGVLSPAEVVLSLVGNAGYARWHHAYLAAKKTAAADPAAKAEMERLRNLFSGADKTARLKAECELLDSDYEAAKALDLGEKRLRSINRQMTNRGCA